MLDVLMLTAGYTSPLVLLAGAVAVADWIYDRRQARNRAQIAPEPRTREESGRNRKPVSVSPAPRGPVPAGQRLPVRVVRHSEPVTQQSGVTPMREEQGPSSDFRHAA